MPGDHGVRACIDQALDVVAIRHSSCRPDGNGSRHVENTAQGGTRVPHADDMAAGVVALRHQAGHPISDGFEGVLGRADGVQHVDSGRAQLTDDPGCAPGVENDDGHPGIDACTHVGLLGERQQEVRGDRPPRAGQRPRLPQCCGERARRHDSQRAEAAGCRDGAGQRRACDPTAHPGLDDRTFQIQPGSEAHRSIMT